MTVRKPFSTMLDTNATNGGADLYVAKYFGADTQN